MNDVTDGLLLDVREISITDLEFTDADSALSRALERILASKPERALPVSTTSSADPAGILSAETSR